jgi:hypothetical protein
MFVIADGWTCRRILRVGALVQTGKSRGGWDPTSLELSAYFANRIRTHVRWFLGVAERTSRNAASDNDNRTCGAVTLTLLIEPLPLPDAVGGCSDAVVVFES